jgi:ketosteroid isomerase-like protein
MRRGATLQFFKRRTLLAAIAMTPARHYHPLELPECMSGAGSIALRAQVRTIVEALYASWAVKDLDSVLACCADDIVFAIHVSTDIMPFAGETRGKADIAPRLQMILDGFHFLAYRPLHICEDDDQFHAQVLYHFRHKVTGHEIEGTMRHVGRIEGDKVVRLDEFHDTARLQAFFGLLAQSESGVPERDFPHIKRNR